MPPFIYVTGRRYAEWLVEHQGWEATAGGACRYIHPDDVWTQWKIKGVGHGAGPKGTDSMVGVQNAAEVPPHTRG